MMRTQQRLFVYVIAIISTLSACQQNTSEKDAIPEPQEIIACTDDLKACPDGRQVERNPNLNCEFNPCDGSAAEELTICTMDVKACPDGSYVSRDPKNNCAFSDCPDLPN